MPSRIKIVLLICALGIATPVAAVAAQAIDHSEFATSYRQEDERKRKRPPKKGKEKKETAPKENPKQESSKEPEKANKSEKETSKTDAKNQGFGWGTVLLTVFITLGAAAGGLFFLVKYKAKSVVKALGTGDTLPNPVVVEAHVIAAEPIVAKREDDAPLIAPIEKVVEKPRVPERLPARDAISYKDAPKFDEPSGASALDESPMLFDDSTAGSDAALNSMDAAMINQLIEKQSDKTDSKTDPIDASDDLILPEDNDSSDLLEIPKKESEEKPPTPVFEDVLLDDMLLNETLLDDSLLTTVGRYNAATTPAEQHAFAEQMIPCAIENLNDAIEKHAKPMLGATPDGIFLVSKTPLDAAEHYELFVAHGLELSNVDVQARIKPAFKVFYSDDIETDFQIKSPAMVTKQGEHWMLATQGEILLKA